MALTRSMLKGMGLTEEQVSAIIDAHTETVDGLKKDRDAYKADAEKYAAVKKELDELKSGNDDWQSKYETEHKAYEEYKKGVADKERTEAVREAYKKLLLAEHVGEKHVDSILRVTDLSKMKLGEDGKLEGQDKLVETIKSDWSGFIQTVSEKGAQVETPPTGNSAKPTRAEIYKKDDHGRYVYDSVTRQQMLAESMTEGE